MVQALLATFRVTMPSHCLYTERYLLLVLQWNRFVVSTQQLMRELPKKNGKMVSTTLAYKISAGHNISDSSQRMFDALTRDHKHVYFKECRQKNCF